MGSFHLRPPVFFMPSDASLPIIDLTNRLVLEVDRAVGDLPRNRRPGFRAVRRSRGLRLRVRCSKQPCIPEGSGAAAAKHATPSEYKED